MVLVGLLLEIFQSVQGLGALLDLVKDDQCLPRQDLLPGNQGQQFDDPLGIFVGLKDGVQFVFLVKVEVDSVLVTALPELLHQPGLAYLPGALQHHGFAVLAGFPALQRL